MPLLFVVFIVVLVNFTSSVLAQETTTKLRGPRSTDTVPAPPTVGPLAPSDTLWRVAERIRPQPDISLYQVMSALYLKNPDAFLENNLNHLRPGAVLVLPSTQEMQQIDINLARQKSQQDDERWAQRQKVATEQQASTAAVPGQTTTAKAAPAQWRAELEQLSQQQRQDLDALRGQFADSMQLVESMVGENLQLKTSLARVQQELELLKSQLGEDSEIQQQLKQLLQQQQQLLQEKAEQQAKQAESDWSSSLSHPLIWVLAACIPALLVLSGVLFWVKRRGQRTEQVVNAATTEAAANPSYHSPLPPLDDNNDVDESLFEIDDALLEDAFSDTPAQEQQALHDDLLEFDDALSFDDDDSLLPPDAAPLQADIDADIIAEEFDPENILSDDDLSALLAAADDDDDVIELADDSAQTEDISALVEQDDDLLAQADDDILSEPLAEQDSGLSAVPDEDSSFDIDELIEEIDLDEPDTLELDEPSQAEQLSAALSKTVAVEAIETEAAVELLQDDFIIETESGATETQQYSPDRSELDDFAECLAGEMLADEQVEALSSPDSEAPEPETTADEESLLSAELSELLDQASDLMPSAQARAETEPLENHQPADTAASELAAEEALAEPAENNADLLSDDDILMLDDLNADADDKGLSALDLTSADDDSVQRPTEGALSVENPSKMLEQYPELELTEDDLLADITPDMLLDELNDLSDNQAGSTGDIPELELDPEPDAQFDTLMSELEAMADNLDQAERDNSTQQANEDLLAELEQTSVGEHNFADEDFVEIDSLLASAGSSQDDAQRFTNLNVDVGLDEYAAIIGEHEQRDVDVEDNGYSAKLDLVRAYIEIDDTESAELLLDEILTSDAPEHVKTEAQRLKS